MGVLHMSIALIEKMSSESPRYIVAGSRAWNRSLFNTTISYLPGEWQFAATPEELEEAASENPQPKYIFFLHWNRKLSDDFVKQHKCVCFHMTDVPYGRGGSPLQNLIQRGHRETRLSALRMIEQMDAGPVYMKKPLSLEGSAEEIYLRAGRLSSEMISEIIAKDLEPVPQVGTPVIFERRLPSQSEIPDNCRDLQALHDFIRMLDADGYPPAFIDFSGFRFEFSRSALADGKVTADVRVTMLPHGADKTR
jgi:methionyl-tRNA formyltransferase